MWLDEILSHKYPRLASSSKIDGILVLEVMQAEDLDTLFMLPLSVHALQELDLLQEQLQELDYDETSKDSWKPVWGDKYTSRRFYSQVFDPIEAHPIYKIIWKSRCTPHVKFFAWLVLVDRLNTKDMLQRCHLNIQDGPECVMCSVGELETIDHLFFSIVNLLRIVG